jgi:hypothetical protein
MSSLSDTIHQKLPSLPVFGIAGNFADHLQQAGEDADFVSVKTSDPNAPKGIFPIYIPGHKGQLGVYPLCTDKIVADFSQALNLQAEPEMCLFCDIAYSSDKQSIAQIMPQAFTAFNDCSIRRPNARKISDKKNWGACSKGIAKKWLPCPKFEAPSCFHNYQIATFLQRDGACLTYGIDSPVESYSYFYQTLINWMQNTFNQQQDQGPLEDLHQLLAESGHPEQCVITLGATRYTTFGESHYLQPGDTLSVLLYNRDSLNMPTAKEACGLSPTKLPEDCILLQQTIEDKLA